MYIINPMYIFKTDHLALDNQLMCSTLGKTTIKSFHFKWHHFSNASCFYDQILIRWNLQREMRGFIMLTVWREVVTRGRDGITAEKSGWKFHRSRNVFLGPSPYILTKEEAEGKREVGQYYTTSMFVWQDSTSLEVP